MNCSGCEARREWIRNQTNSAKMRMQLLLQRLSSGTSSNNKVPDGSIEKSKSYSVPDNGSE